MGPAAVPIIMGVTGALAAGATAYAANKQSQAQKDAISRQIAEDKRRRKPYETAAFDLSQLFSGQFGAANGAYSGFAQASPLYADAASRLRGMLQEDPAAAQARLLSGTTEATNAYMTGTEPSAAIQRNKLLEGVVSNVGGRYGNRAGTAGLRLGGEAVNEFEANRLATAAGLAPSFMNAILGLQGMGLNAAQMGLAAGQNFLGTATNFATQQPTQAPMLTNPYAGAGSASLLTGLAQAGQSAATLYQNYQNQKQMNALMQSLVAQNNSVPAGGLTYGPNYGPQPGADWYWKQATASGSPYGFGV